MEHTRRDEARDALTARYGQAIALAFGYMQRHRVSQGFLAGRLGIDRSQLNRFLSRHPDFVPLPDRPRKRLILERILTVCSEADLIANATLPPPPADLGDDGLWFYNHHQRLLQLSGNLDGVQVLGMIGELCAQARHMPEQLRAAACVSTLLRLSGAVSRPEASHATTELLLATLRRCRELHERALASAPAARTADIRRHAPARADSYAGRTEAYLGLHLRDDGLVESGLRHLSAAAVAGGAPEDGPSLWANLFRVVDDLLEAGHRLSELAAAKAAELSLSHWSEDIRYTLCERNHYPRLGAHWRGQAPALDARLTEGEVAR